MTAALTSIALIVLSTWVGLLLAYARPLAAFWREPVFNKPILIFESDDWGPAPPDHAEVLAEIAGMLQYFRDREGHHPVMTLGVTLAIPEGNSPPAAPLKELTLDEPQFVGIVETMKRGKRDGVFQLQLHGRSHYWSQAVERAAATQAEVVDWLASPNTWQTEALPDALQTRWAPEVDGQQLTIPACTARTAAEQEGLLFAACFGEPAVVAVPTTFVWNRAVEQGWSNAGIRAIVTPGRHYEQRSQFGRPDTAALITNSMRANGIVYVVRDRYFEPFKGHTAEDGLHALEANTALGRPTLLETHRANFIETDLRNRSLEALQALLRRALKRYPELRFLSTAELVEAMAQEQPDLITKSMRARIRFWSARVRTLPRFWKLSRLSGLALVIASAARLARAA
jgi:hypothetical protein